jgi:hypothetical protein
MTDADAAAYSGTGDFRAAVWGNRDATGNDKDEARDSGKLEAAESELGDDRVGSGDCGGQLDLGELEGEGDDIEEGSATEPLRLEERASQRCLVSRSSRMCSSR